MAGALLALALFISSASAAPGDDYTAAVAPDAVQPGATGIYTIALTNDVNSPDNANNAHVDIPAFSVDPSAPLTATTTSAGSCSSTAWTATLDTSSTPNAIQAVAPPAPADELCPGATLLISFTATAPGTQGQSTWTTTLAHDTSAFSLQGTDATVTVDNTPPPVPTISSGPPTPSNDPSPSFSFADADPTAVLKCGVDGVFVPCASPYTASVAEGPHTFAVQASDAAGNASTSVPYNWTVDTTPPLAPSFSSAPPNVTNLTSATFDFSDGDPNDGYLCSFEGAGFSACASPQVFNNLGAGPHSFDVKAVDLAGNIGPVQSSAWTIDLTNPLATIDPTTEPSDPTNATSGSFVFMSSNGGLSFDCALDNASFGPCASPVPFGPLADGAHSFAVRTTNLAGTTGPATIWSWTVDTAAPAAPIVTSAPVSRTKSRSATIAFHGAELGLQYSCRLDVAGFVPCSSPAVYGNLPDGAHTFAVGSTDAAGNSGPTAQRQWIVDTGPPHTRITGAPSAVSSGQSASFAFAANETASFVCSLDGGTFSPCSSPKAYGGLHNGGHTFRVRATDLAGNVEQAAQAYGWQVLLPDTTAPGKVRQLKKNVRYGVFRLSWLLPPDADLAHIQIRRATSATGLETTVYDGRGRSYVDRRFPNGSLFVYRIRSYDGTGNGSGAATVSVSPAALLRAPGAGRAVRGSARFAWAAVPRATFYNVQLYRGAQKLLSAWPAKAKLAPGKRWVYQGRHFRLAKGSYRWYVWPGFGARSRAKYGHLLGTAMFRVR